MIVGLSSISHMDWEHPKDRDWVCVTSAITEASSQPPTTGWLLYGCFKRSLGRMILTPHETRLPCRLQDLIPYVYCELLQEFQEKIGMSIAENPNPQLGLAIIWEGCRSTVSAPNPAHLVSTCTTHLGRSQVGQEGLDLKGHLV